MSATSEGESSDDATDGGEPTRTTTHRPGDDVVHPDGANRSFGWRGDVLLVVLFLSLIVAPVLVYLRPPAIEWRVRLLILPMLPGLLLALVAVWATTRP
ncbi:hypothetical protein [Salinarchaeum laminariae]|uniref:hypothetical protein n=1 Tax=Salinarchaeum laminariae TaxID=869888 RepID=UPI0020C0372C|nr:hypothetical protein [Salinarchaeum laminariae]